MDVYICLLHFKYDILFGREFIVLLKGELNPNAFILLYKFTLAYIWYKFLILYILYHSLHLYL